MFRRGFYIAKGDRRGFVAVDWRGEVYSLSRMLGVKRKDLKQKLREAKNLPSVDSIKSELDQKLAQRAMAFTEEIKQNYQRRFAPLLAQKDRIAKRHQLTRNLLAEKDALINHQLQEQSVIQGSFDHLKSERQADTEKLKQALFSKLSEEKIIVIFFLKNIQ